MVSYLALSALISVAFSFHPQSCFHFCRVKHPSCHSFTFSLQQPVRRYLRRSSGRSFASLGRGCTRNVSTKQNLRLGGFISSQTENDFPDGSTSSKLQRRVCIMDAPVGGADAGVNPATDYADIVSRVVSQTSLPLHSETIGESAIYTHCLSVVPYESTYAIAITPMQENHKRKNGKRRRRPPKKNLMKPFYVDLCPPGDAKLGKRTKGQTGTDLLIKAVAPIRGGRNADSQEQTGAVVYDLTAGFGQDSVVIANGGASEVHMVERDPVVATLLEDALRRLRFIAQNGDMNKSRAQQAFMLSQKLTMEVAEGIDVARKVSLQNNRQMVRPDICYLDPMFPPRTKSAAVKKNMQVLHELLDLQNIAKSNHKSNQPPSNGEELNLLEAAIDAARVRVVVKRPINAPRLGDRTPSYDIRGSVNRWDVYVK